LDVKIADPGTQRAISLRQPDAALGRVVENKLLTRDAVQDKRHIGGYLKGTCDNDTQQSLFFFFSEFELPVGMTYSAGDYLAILPTNPKASVKRVLKHFKLSDEVGQSFTTNFIFERYLFDFVGGGHDQCRRLNVYITYG
jgi:cytochrome P450/NADPH-cytochrome P450 reductase